MPEIKFYVLSSSAQIMEAAQRANAEYIPGIPWVANRRSPSTATFMRAMPVNYTMHLRVVEAIAHWCLNFEEVMNRVTSDLANNRQPNFFSVQNPTGYEPDIFTELQYSVGSIRNIMSILNPAGISEHVFSKQESIFIAFCMYQWLRRVHRLGNSRTRVGATDADGNNIGEVESRIFRGHPLTTLHPARLLQYVDHELGWDDGKNSLYYTKGLGMTGVTITPDWMYATQSASQDENELVPTLRPLRSLLRNAYMTRSQGSGMGNLFNPISPPLDLRHGVDPVGGSGYTFSTSEAVNMSFVYRLGLDSIASDSYARCHHGTFCLKIDFGDMIAVIYPVIPVLANEEEGAGDYLEFQQPSDSTSSDRESAVSMGVEELADLDDQRQQEFLSLNID
jgi:hypothetical protein